jgi:hypothetical protein
MEDMSAILMDINVVFIVSIAVACDVVSFFNYKNGLALLYKMVSKDCIEQSSSN